MLDAISAQSTDYLSLLTIQLQHQDPLSPTDQQDLVSDLTQFSIVEGIENLNASFADMLRMQEVTQGMNLVDKTVVYRDPLTATEKTGSVSELFVENNSINLLIDEQRVPISLVSRIVA